MTAHFKHRYIAAIASELPYEKMSTLVMPGSIKNSVGVGLALCWASGRIDFPMNLSNRDAIEMVRTVTSSHFRWNPRHIDEFLHPGVLGDTLGMKSIDVLLVDQSKWQVSDAIPNRLWQMLREEIVAKPDQKILVNLKFESISEPIEHGFGAIYSKGQFSLVDVSMGGQLPIPVGSDMFRQHCDEVLDRFQSETGKTDLRVVETRVLLPVSKTAEDRKVKGWEYCENPELEAALAQLIYEESNGLATQSFMTIS